MEITNYQSIFYVYSYVASCDTRDSEERKIITNIFLKEAKILKMSTVYNIKYRSRTVHRKVQQLLAPKTGLVILIQKVDFQIKMANIWQTG